MTTRSEDTLLYHLTEGSSLEYLVREGFDAEVIPTSHLRPIARWAIKYYIDSGYALAPSRQALLETWGSALEASGAELLPEDEDADSIAWTVQDLKARHVRAKFHDFLLKQASGISSATPDQMLEIVAGAAEELMAMTMSLQSKRHETTGSEGVRRALENYKIRAAREEIIQGMTLGFPELDDHTMGIHPGELCITIAPQAMGKSILSVLAAIDNWLRGKRVVLFTLENSVEMTWDRVLVGMINRLYGEELDGTTWLKAEASIHHLQKAKEIREMMEERDTFHVIMPDRHSRSPEALISKAMMLEADCVIIDQLTFMTKPEGSRAFSTTEVYKDILHSLKELISTQANIPCLLMHQLNREGVKSSKEGKVDVTQAAGSAEVERTADQLFAIHQSTTDEMVSRANLQMLKNRRGPLKSYWVSWKRGEVSAGVIGEVTYQDAGDE